VTRATPIRYLECSLTACPGRRRNGRRVSVLDQYPLVQITNNSTKDVFYARTHDHSTMGVATGSKTVSTHFDVPSGMETGASSLVVVANGFLRAPFQ